MLVASLVMISVQGQVALKDGLVISKSRSVAKGDYLVQNALEDGTGAAITVSGNGITVDFKGAVLRGTPADTEPDARKGTGLIIKGKNVTIKNLVVRGYKIGLFARGVQGLKLIDCDFSYNWKQRLRSTPEREDESDWMSFHQNEKDEWLRYGAGAYLRDCDNVEVRGCTAVGGQCGLMMTECEKGLVWNNNFSFLSAIGVGMYRCNENRVMHNKIDWCVRGYSHGVYNRGQDSAGILVYEQSNKNVFAYNSVTHGGDGFFLWAGQTTMDTGQGGCNDNLLYGNDFSHAVTNGIEATFSRNNFVNNLIMECWHGIWGGYSYESKVIGNFFKGNAEGIAWEHGQDNLIQGNVFLGDRTAIDVWQKDSEDPDWGYAKKRDTRNRDIKIEGNVFKDVFGPTLRISRSRTVSVTGNSFDSCQSPEAFLLLKTNAGLKVEGNAFKVAAPPTEVPPGTNAIAISAQARPNAGAMLASGNLDTPKESSSNSYSEQFRTDWDALKSGQKHAVKPLKGGASPFLSSNDLRGRKYIIIDEWGPYDFKSPRLVERGTDSAGRTKFDILGPVGNWKIHDATGVKWTSASEGRVPGSLLAEFEDDANDVKIVLQFKGFVLTDYRGVNIPVGQEFLFSYAKFNAPINWRVKWFTYDPATQDPRKTEAWKAIMAGTPVREASSGSLNYAWGGSPGEGVPSDAFLTLAEGTFQIKEGDYVLEVTSDDGVRVYLDDKMVFEDWTWHAPKTDSIPVRLGGKHKVRVEHFELDGYSVLKASVRKRR